MSLLAPLVDAPISERRDRSLGAKQTLEPGECGLYELPRQSYWRERGCANLRAS